MFCLLWWKIKEVATQYVQYLCYWNPLPQSDCLYLSIYGVCSWQNWEIKKCISLSGIGNFPPPPHSELFWCPLLTGTLLYLSPGETFLSSLSHKNDATMFQFSFKSVWCRIRPPKLFPGWLVWKDRHRGRRWCGHGRFGRLIWYSRTCLERPPHWP